MKHLLQNISFRTSMRLVRLSFHNGYYITI